MRIFDIKQKLCGIMEKFWSRVNNGASSTQNEQSPHLQMRKALSGGGRTLVSEKERKKSKLIPFLSSPKSAENGTLHRKHPSLRPTVVRQKSAQYSR